MRVAATVGGTDPADELTETDLQHVCGNLHASSSATVN